MEKKRYAILNLSNYKKEVDKMTHRILIKPIAILSAV